MKTAKDLMTSPAECLTPDETVLTAARMLAKYDVGSMPVVDGNKLVGVLTDRDIVVRAVAKGLDPAATPVRDVASGKVVSVHADDTAEAVAAMLAEHQIRRVPVLDASGAVAGVVAQADVARELGEAETGEVVKEISEE